MSNCKKCGYYSDGECNICGMGMSGEDTFCRLCKDNPNCYYKQLSELKTENGRLKEEILKFRWDNPYFDLYNNVVNQRDMWEQKSEQHKFCLQEIKEIANNIVYSDEIPACVNDKECPLNDGDGFDNHCNMRCPFILGKQILDLITKAEEG